MRDMKLICNNCEPSGIEIGCRHNLRFAEPG
jgi:hypothetical protein